MSSNNNRYRNNQGNNNTYIPRGPPRPQQTYVPQTISNSLRQPFSGGSFVVYLPQDDAVASGLRGDVDPAESQRAVDLLNKELSRLLRLNPKDFWREVATDTSLHAFLESFLKYKSRWYDFPHRLSTQGNSIVGESQLCRRVFMVLHRVSSNRDPGALSPRDHSALLQETKLLDLPKLLDICALFGHENVDLTRSVVENGIKAQPWLHNEFTKISKHFLNVVHTVYQRCTSSLDGLSSSTKNLQDQAVSQLRSNCLEVMDFVNDTVVNLDAFVQACNHAAVFFCCPVNISNGKEEELLATLAKLHDSLIPSLQKGLGSDERVLTSASLLLSRMVEFGGKLLNLCYLGKEAFQAVYPYPSNMFPAMTDEPMVRTEILVQKLRMISGEDMQGSFLQNIEKQHQIIDRIDFLQSIGWLSIDEEQKVSLSDIFGQTWGLKSKDKSHMGGENAAFFEAEISQIRDLFPEYGKAFLAACLEVYKHSAEEVIQRILDGTLREDLQTLDTSLEQIPRKNPSATHQPQIPSSSSAGSSVHQPAEQPKLPPAVGRFTRKATLQALDEENLDVKDDKFASKNSALILQMEYEDEYDDSFDELGLGVADSGTGDSEADTSASSSAKWSSRSKKPQYFVKDGKNYSYKVPGAVAASNYNEAALVQQTQAEKVQGLGRGGRRGTEIAEPEVEEGDGGGARGGRGGSGRGRGDDGGFRGGRGGRGRGGRGGGDERHHRKNLAAKKYNNGVFN